MQLSQQANKTRILRVATSRQRGRAAFVFLAIAALLAVPWLIAHYGIDTGWWLGYCGFKQRYGLPCPTCGMTTAVLAFAQGKIKQAFYIQPAAAFLCSLMVFTALISFLIAVFGVYFSFIDRLLNKIKISHVLIALVVIIAAGWAVTMARALTS